MFSLYFQRGDQSCSKADFEHCKISETSIEEEEGSQEEASNNGGRKLSISQKINRDLDETALMLERLTQSLFPGEVGVLNGGGGEGGEGVTGGVVKRVRREWRKSRQSTVSASISEPDLTQVLYVCTRMMQCW